MDDHGINCEPLDLPKSIDAVARAYKAGGLEAPKFHFVAGSPISGSIMGVCLQRYFRGLENDLREPKILDRPFLDEAAKCVDELTRELTTYAQTGNNVMDTIAAMRELKEPLQTLQEYIDKNHIEHCSNGGTLPLKLPDVAVDAANQLAIELVDAITETTNEGPVSDRMPAKTPTALPEKLAPLGRTNLARFQSLVATTVALVLANLAQAQNGKALATRFTNDPKDLLFLVHRRLRRSLHSWLVEKIEAIKKRDIPKEIDEEFARGCQQQFSDQANGNHDTSWSCYYADLFARQEFLPPLPCPPGDHTAEVAPDARRVLAVLEQRCSKYGAGR